MMTPMTMTKKLQMLMFAAALTLSACAPALDPYAQAPAVSGVLATVPAQDRGRWSELVQSWAALDFSLSDRLDRTARLESLLIVCGEGGLAPLSASELRRRLRQAAVADGLVSSETFERWDASPVNHLILECPDGLKWEDVLG